MALKITHNKVATYPDEPGAEINKAEWNEDHVVVGTTDDLPEGLTNLYFTNLRATTALTGANISIFNNDAGYITTANGAGGSNTQVQFNDGGGFAGDPMFVWDNTTKRLGIGGNPTSEVYIQNNALGTTLVDSNGLMLENTTLAAAGAQQISPPVVWSGQGWKTTATAASQQVEFAAYTLPVQGTTTPTGNWIIASSTNGGSYSTRMSVSTAGLLTTTAITLAGALSGVTTISNSSTHTLTRTGLANTSTDGSIQTNTTASTVGAQVQRSPRSRWSGTVWDTGAAASRTSNWIAENIPTGGNPGTSRLAFSYDYNAGGYNERVSFSDTGNVTATSFNGVPLTTAGSATTYLDATGNYTTPASGGTGTVTSVSVVNANGFDGMVATSTTTPAITLSTTVTGVVKGNGTALSAATPGTDYSAGTSALATGIIKSTTGTGALTIAVPGTDYVTPSTLSSYVPYTGATTTVDLNTQSLRSGNYTLSNGADRTIKMQDSISGLANSLTVQGAKSGAGSNFGGAVGIFAGNGGDSTGTGVTSGSGGDLFIGGGQAGLVSNSNTNGGAGGNITINAGLPADSTVTGTGTNRGGNGGNISINAAAGGLGFGGTVSTIGGDASIISVQGQAGGDALFGDASTPHTGGRGTDISFMAGSGGNATTPLRTNTAGTAGSINFTAGNAGLIQDTLPGQTSKVGGSINFTAGDATQNTVANSNGGSMYFLPGLKSPAGTSDGNLELNKSSGGTVRGKTIANSTINMIALTANRALVLDSNKDIVVSATTNTQIGYLSTTTSDVQTQLNGKANTSGNLSQFAATTSAQLASVISDETGTGALVFANSPVFTTPNIGNATGNISGNAATVTTNANLTGAITSTGNATSLGSFTSAQLATALTDETGSGAAVFATSPTLVTPNLGTPSTLVATNATGTAAGLTAGAVSTIAGLVDGDGTTITRTGSGTSGSPYILTAAPSLPQAQIFTVTGTTATITVDFTTYIGYDFRFCSVPITASAFTAQGSSNGGSTFDTSSTNGKSIVSTAVANSATLNGTTALSNGASGNVAINVEIWQPSTSGGAYGTAQGGSGNNTAQIIGSFSTNSTAALDRIRFNGLGSTGFIIYSPIARR